LGVLDGIASEQGEVAADRPRTALSGLCGWAIERGYCDANPTLSPTFRRSAMEFPRNFFSMVCSRLTLTGRFGIDETLGLFLPGA